MASRKNSDEHYVIDLCDEILGLKASRQHTFDFLRGDGEPGRKLPVDAYYPNLKLVVEYKERQHTESVAFFNKKTTVSGVSHDEQRRIYKGANLAEMNLLGMPVPPGFTITTEVCTE